MAARGARILRTGRMRGGGEAGTRNAAARQRLHAILCPSALGDAASFLAVSERAGVDAGCDATRLEQERQC